VGNESRAADSTGPWLAGVDGCRGGWLAVLLQAENGKMEIW
jgi:predicted RNase H-like nuclease